MKMSWIITRRTTTLSIVSDLLISIFIYYSVFQEKFGSNPKTIVPVLFAFFWIIGSYILGRYIKIKTINFGSIINSILKTILLLILCNIIYFFINLFFPLLIFSDSINQNFFSIKLSSVFIKISFYIAIVSLIVQSVFNILYNKINNNKNNWIFLGTYYKYKKILKEMKVKEKEITLKMLSINKNIDENDLKNVKGIIIEDYKKISKFNIDKIFELKTRGLKVESLLSWFEREFQRIPTDILKNKYQLVTRINSLEDNYQLRFKRIIDINFSLILLLITSPLCLLISLLIVLEDNGPIFYSQIRTGQNGKRIKIIKFRSMKIDAEKDGIQWSKKFDPRITKVGRIIRATRLDEIPQLICVIRGSMSLIGPRPERPEIEEKYLEELAFYKLRYLLKPGLSGWAQVSFRYGASVLDTKKKLSYDIYYISHFSILLDLLIFFKTLKLVLNAKGSSPQNDI